jgi:hypothetical protein
MIDITPLAQENLTEFLTAKKLPLAVRLTFPSDCGGEGRLILVPDQPAPGDISVDFGPLTLCLSRDIHAQVGRVLVDFRDEGHDYGFVIECERPPADTVFCDGCTSCG